ncbi:MAG: glycosyltransferase family 4 protein, partial [Gemmatimonadota bacterium]|nr:glycosyltransferase family 4 protein [Gemmatimonadota bacterium]
RGGATETVLDGATGVLFDQQTVDGLAEAIRQFEGASFDPSVCRRNAERFDSAEFRAGIRRAVDEAMGQGGSDTVPPTVRPVRAGSA